MADIIAAAKSVIDQLNKKHGAGSIMLLSDKSAITSWPSIPTGSLSIDVATGIGGVPLGRITEIYGQESSGKSTICYHIIREAQKAYPDHMAAIVDVEYSTDDKYLKAIGVDRKLLAVSQPDYGDQALGIVEDLAMSGKFSVVVLDSVAGLVPKAEFDGEIGDSHIGLQARLMSQGLRKIAGACSKTDTAIVFTNQIREKIGVMFGNPETTPGGRALKFWSSLRLETRSKKDTNKNRSEVKVTVSKNKLAAPFKIAIAYNVWGSGFDSFAELLALGSEYGLFTKGGGGYYKYEGESFRSFEEMKEIEKAQNVSFDQILREALLNEEFEVDEIEEEEEE